MEMNSKSKPKWLSFLGGFVAGSLVSLLVIAVVSAVLFLTSFDTKLYTGEVARSHIQDAGIDLPSSANDLYFSFQPQFADYLDTWISFSASQSDCTKTAEAVASHEVFDPVFQPGTKSRFEHVSNGPAHHHPEFASPSWDLSQVTNGIVFETRRVFVLVDKDHNKVYIAKRAE